MATFFFVHPVLYWYLVLILFCLVIHILGNEGSGRMASRLFITSRHTTLKQPGFNVDATSRRCINVESTLFQRCVSTGYVVVVDVCVR